MPGWPQRAPQLVGLWTALAFALVGNLVAATVLSSPALGVLSGLLVVVLAVLLVRAYRKRNAEINGKEH